jgi:hypothetical protein
MGDGRQSSEVLPDYGVCYLEHVAAEYKTTKLSGPLPPSVDEILTRYASEKRMTWADLYVLETEILKIQPFATIKRRAWSLRDKYREVAGPLEYNAYLASQPPNENDPKVVETEVRADLNRVLDTLHWNYSLIPIRERLRGSIINRIGLGIAGCGVVLALLAWACASYDERLLATLILVAFAGCLGGFVSMQRRIGQVPNDGDPLLSIFQLNSGLSTLYMAPASGAIFALVLFALFAGRLVEGSIFPVIHHASNFYWGDIEWAMGDYPVASYAKLLVWSFIAGFAERFVPDILDRLIARGQAATQATPSPLPASPAPPADAASPPRDILPEPPPIGGWYWSPPPGIPAKSPP